MQQKICGAAEHSGVNTSTIARQIKLFEKEMGHQLFERRPRGVAPTGAAELLFKYYRDNYNLQCALEADLQALSEMRRGSIRIAMPATFVDTLMSVFDDFCHQYPHIHLHIDEIFESSRIVNQVLDDISHIGIVHFFPKSPDITYYKKVPLPLKLLVSKNHPLASQCKVTLSEAVRYPMSLPAAPDIFLPTMQSIAIAENVVLPPPAFTSNSTAGRKRFARAGAGVIFMSTFSARAEIKAGELVALEVDHPVFTSTELALIVRRGKPFPPATNQLLRLLSSKLSIFTEKPEADDSELVNLVGSFA